MGKTDVQPKFSSLKEAFNRGKAGAPKISSVMHQSIGICDNYVMHQSIGI
jgi:hypothetical protein